MEVAKLGVGLDFGSALVDAKSLTGSLEKMTSAGDAAVEASNRLNEAVRREAAEIKRAQQEQRAAADAKRQATQQAREAANAATKAAADEARAQKEATRALESKTQAEISAYKQAERMADADRRAAQAADARTRAMALQELEAHKLNDAFDKQQQEGTLLGGMYGQLTAAAIGYKALQYAKEAIQLADAYTNIQSRLTLVTHGTDELSRVTTELFRVSQDTRSALESNVALYASLVRSTKSLGLSETELVTITRTVGQSFLISGASATETSAAVRQLSQALASGVLRGEEFNSIAENAPRLQQAVAESLGVTIGELRAMAAEGKITSAVITKALLDASTTINEEAAKIAPTVGGATQKAANSFLLLIGRINEATGFTHGLSEAIDGVATAAEKAAGNQQLIKFFHDVAAGARGTGAVLLDLGSGILDIDKLILGTAAGALGTYTGSLSTLRSGADLTTSSLDALEDAFARTRKAASVAPAKSLLGFSDFGSNPKPLAPAAGSETKELSADYLKAAAAAEILRDRQKELSTALGFGSDTVAEINARYDLKARLLEIDAQATGKDATLTRAQAETLKNLARETDGYVRSLRELAQAKDAQRIVDEANKKNADIEAKQKAEVQKLLDDEVEKRAKGLALADKDAKQQAYELSLIGQVGTALYKLQDAHLAEAKAQEYVAAGLDYVTAGRKAEVFVMDEQAKRQAKLVDLAKKYRDELNGKNPFEIPNNVTSEFDHWADSLRSANDAFTSLADGLEGDAQRMVKSLGAVSGAIQLLLTAQEQWAKSHKSWSDTGLNGDMRTSSTQKLGVAGAGFGIGYGIGSTGVDPRVSVLGGAAAGAAAGAVVGPIGAAIGGFAGMIGGILGSAKAARENEAANIALVASYRLSVKSIQDLVDGATPLSQSLDKTTQDFIALRQQLGTRPKGDNPGQKFLQAVYDDELSKLNKLEADRVAQLKREAEQLQANFKTSNDALELSLAGRDAEATALLKGLAIREAVKAAEDKYGKSAETARLETLLLAQAVAEMAKAQADFKAGNDVLDLRVRGLGAEADAMQTQIDIQAKVDAAIKLFGNTAEVARYQTLLLADAQRIETEAKEAAAKAAAAETERVRRSVFDTTNATQAFGDSRGANEAAFFENLRRRYDDAATAAEKTAESLYALAATLDFFAKRLEADTRFSEGTANSVFNSLGGGRGAEDYARTASNRQARVNASGESQFNQDFLAFSQRAADSAVRMQREIEDGTKALNQQADNAVAANNVLIDVIRTDAADQIAKIDAQIKTETEKFDALIAGQQAAAAYAQQLVQVSEQQLQATTRAFDALSAYSKGFALSDASTLSPTQKAEEARRQFEAQAGLARGGDRNAAAGLPALAEAFLSASRNVNASGAGYATDANQVQSTIDALTQQYGGFVSAETNARDNAQRAMEAAQAQVQYLSDLKQTAIDELNERKSGISKDAQSQIDKLEELNRGIRDALPLAISALVADATAANQQRIKDDPFYKLFEQFVNTGLAPEGYGGTPTPVVLPPREETANEISNAAALKQIAADTTAELTESREQNSNLRTLVNTLTATNGTLLAKIEDMVTRLEAAEARTQRTIDERPVAAI